MPNGVAPSTPAASRMSEGWLCRPASMINIMNGVHCQTRTVTIDASGWSEMKATALKPRKGSTVTRILKSSAGSRGSRRRHGEEKGSPTRPLAVGRTVASAATFMNQLLDRLRRDALTLAQRVGVLRRAGDHAREELGAAIADVLELWDADVLHTR